MRNVARLIERIDDEMTPDETSGENKTINAEHLRMVEALLFAASEPLDEKALATSLPEGADITALLEELQLHYERRGVTLLKVADKWQFRTASDLAFLLRKEKPEQKRLSRAALETLAIVAYHQPVTRAEIEDIRGVALSKGTIDILMEIGWVKIRGRKRTPGRPVTFGTTDSFLVQFGLESVGHLPGADELKPTSSRPPASWKPCRPPVWTCRRLRTSSAPTKTPISRAKMSWSWLPAAAKRICFKDVRERLSSPRRRDPSGC
jgi:segregation and condensation protein B